MQIIHAVIYLPAVIALTDPLAAHCLEHITRRGYALFTVARDWSLVQLLLRQGTVQVVVLARREHLDPDFTPRVEVVGQDTRDNRPALMQRNPGRNRDERPRIRRLPPAG
jgi:hypothetical protein